MTPNPGLRVAVTGASGLIGSILGPVLTARGHEIVRIVRSAPRAGEIPWDPVRNGLEPDALKGIDAVIHLAGENIGARWTKGRKRKVLESRKTGTQLLSEAISRATRGPRILIAASAIGYYGDRGEEPVTEASGPGIGFLPEVVAAWEQATEPAREAGIRVVKLRLGLVLTPAGGLLKKLLPPFRLGLGGRLGPGTQWMSWISADDLAGAFEHALITRDLSGAANVVTQYPVRNADFTRTLGKVLHRPTPFPVPAALLRLLFGQMADEAILGSTRASPTVLARSGFRFRFSELLPALTHLLAK